MQQPPWRKRVALSSIADTAERFLTAAGFDRAPWLTVALMAGIACWFVVPTPVGWVVSAGCGLFTALAATAVWRGREGRTHLLRAAISLGLVFTAGVALIWLRSATVGAEALPAPIADTFEARILERIEQPADERTRLVLATRDSATGEAIKIRVNLAQEDDKIGRASCRERV